MLLDNHKFSYMQKVLLMVMTMTIMVVVAMMMTMTAITITMVMRKMMIMVMMMMTMMVMMKMTRRFVLKGAGYNPMDVLNCLMTRRGYKVASNTIFFKTSFHHLFCTSLLAIPSFQNQLSYFLKWEGFQKGINEKMTKSHGGGTAPNAIKC